MTKYDDLDYHAEAAERAGQPIEHGFAHIAIYLRWLVRSGLHNPDLISDSLASRLSGGRASLVELINETDQKLVSDLMTSTGEGFSDHSYQ